MAFTEKISAWYRLNKRHLPWRETKNPYFIWLSEVMLQQTRVSQGLPYYLKFTNKYPTVMHLAMAPEEEVLKLWQGLGYYTRARNLHATAKQVAFELDGVFPDTYNGLKKLKGVGDYTASAIASICYNEPQPVVDGNVYRVLARYFGVELPINAAEGQKYFKELAKTLLDTKNPGEYNQAVMEFGAVQCKPQSPNCSGCVLNESCVALQKKLVGELPKKKKKTDIKNRFFNYLIIQNKEELLLCQRQKKDIWQNLYEFPLVESAHELNEKELVAHPLFEKLTQGRAYSLELFNKMPKTHKLSHQHIITKFWLVHLQGRLRGGIKKTALKEYPVPVLLANFVEEYGF